MNEMINASTSLFPLLTIDEKNSIYYNGSILSFCIIATINHILPENLNGLTHFVKMLFSNILFALINLNPVIGFILSLSDLTPLFSKNKKIQKFGELFLQIPRQIIEGYLIYTIFQSHYVDCIIMMICKVIYFIERRARIKKGERNDFSSWHSAEHMGLYLLFKDCTGVEFSLKLYAGILFSFMLFISLAIYLFNHYLDKNALKRAPSWILENTKLKAVLQDKVRKNRDSRKTHNYIMKPWTSHMKMEFISWTHIQECCEKIISNVESNKYDIVLGISTGGAFVGAYVAKILNKPYEMIESKLWSGITLKQNFKQSIGYFLGEKISPKIGTIPDIKGKRVLLVDDTTYTGITINNIVAHLKEKCEPVSISTFVLWTKGKTSPTYYYNTKRIPLCWEWGVEVD